MSKNNGESWVDIIAIILFVVTIVLLDHLWACHHEYFIKELMFWK